MLREIIRLTSPHRHLVRELQKAPAVVSGWPIRCESFRIPRLLLDVPDSVPSWHPSRVSKIASILHSFTQGREPHPCRARILLPEGRTCPALSPSGCRRPGRNRLGITATKNPVIHDRPLSQAQGTDRFDEEYVP
jgi:hypothetical protein